jgi:hypothetical protein
MYINLYPIKQLQRTKLSLLGFGIFLSGGGAYALVRELTQREQLQPAWLLGACMVTAIGAVFIALGTNRIHLKDAFFAMNPERISYRLTVYGRERLVHWQAIESINIVPDKIVLRLKTGKKLTLRLGHLQDQQIARHIEASVRLAALQQNISLNGVMAQQQKAIV